MIKKGIAFLAGLILVLISVVNSYAGMSQFFAESVMAQTFNGTSYTFPTKLWVGLYTTCPSGGTGGTEASYTGYSRVEVDPTTANWGTIGTTATASNVNSITIPTNTGTSTQTVYCDGIFDASTGGDVLFVGQFSNSQTINIGGTNTFPAGSLNISLTISP